MSSLIIEGGKPLIGTVKISGAKNSILKIISAAMFSNEDVVVSNVPRVGNVLTDLELIKRMGAKVEWIGNNKLVLNGATLSAFEIPYDLGSTYRTANLLVGPLVFRFGKAIVPVSKSKRPVNRLIEVWRSLGMVVEEEDKYLNIKAGALQSTNVKFKISTHMGTDNAIISSLFIHGETFIHNAAEEPEVDDLISFCNLIGGTVERIEPRLIKVTGSTLFRGGDFEIISDRNEAATFITAALLTNGNVSIKGVDKASITSFVNVLTKMNCKYEFSKDEVRVWRGGEALAPVIVTTAPAPGFMTDWQPLMTLLATQADGTSIICDTVYADRFDYIVDLNRMGAKIDLITPSQAELPIVISDDSYDYSKLGEPASVAKVFGPTVLKGSKINLTHFSNSPTSILAALSAVGKSEITGYEGIDNIYEDFLKKLTNLGAQIGFV